MLAVLAAVGSPKEVALDFTGRFGGQVDRAGLCTPYLIGEGTLREMVATRWLGRPDLARGPIRLTCSPDRT